MCGIAGIVGEPGAIARHGEPLARLRAMTRTLAHRGPDDEGTHRSPRGEAWLGHRRLSIIDLEGGHQPLSSPCGRATVVFNGEIYDYRELRDTLRTLGRRFVTDSDTEVLVQGYLEWGPAVVERLNGMFAFALWDEEERRLVLARDRLGKKPLFYAERDGMLLFGSELRALLAHPAVPRRLDPVALRQYLLYDAVPAPGCIIEGVHKLEAGEVRVWRQGRFESARRYWDLPFGAPPLDEPDAMLEQRLWSALSDAVRLRLRSDVPLGVFLSGGIDSSAVVVAMAEHMPAHEIRTFSVGFRDPTFDESAHARAVAAHLGTEHHEQILEPDAALHRLPEILRAVDEPLADSSLLPTWLLSEHTRRHVTVALGGDGGDELWLGYPTFVAHRWARLAERLPAAALAAARRLADLLPVDTGNISFDYKVKRMLLGLSYPALERHFVWIGALDPRGQRPLLRREVVEAAPDEVVFAPVRRHLERAQGRTELERASYLYAKIYMGDDILTKVDRASMAHGLEARAPLLDYRVAELAARVPLRAKLRHGQTKWLLRRALRGRLPPPILARPKKGFGVPVAEWLKGPLRPWAEPLLDPERVREGGWFEPEAVTRLWREHQEGRADHRKALWSLLVLQHWLEA